MLLAIAVVLGFYTLQVTGFLILVLPFIADEMTGMMFGPVVGGLMGAAADIVKYLVRPTGAFFRLYHQRSIEWCDLRSDSVQETT